MPFKPTAAELAAAVHKTVPDLIAPNLQILFCGINPGLYTAATGWHFGRPGNRFWPALYAAGFTPRLLHPSEQSALLKLGMGITNFVKRTSVSAAELTPTEIREGAEQLRQTVLKYQPKYLAVLGIGTYRIGFNQPKARLGLQPGTIGQTKIWVLPNPSGLNAHFTPQKFAEVFKELKNASNF